MLKLSLKTDCYVYFCNHEIKRKELIALKYLDILIFEKSFNILKIKGYFKK